MLQDNGKHLDRIPPYRYSHLRRLAIPIIREKPAKGSWQKEPKASRRTGSNMKYYQNEI